MADGRAARTITWTAGVLAALIAVLPPLAHLALGHASEVASMRSEARVISGQVSALIARNPDNWFLQELRLRLLLSQDGLDNDHPELRRIITEAGVEGASVTMHAPNGVQWPRLVQSVPVYDQREVVGRVEITRNVGYLLGGTRNIALLSLALGLAGFVVFRVVPMRLLERAVQRAAWLAAHDPLTGLPNRAVFHEKLCETLSLARRHADAVAVLCIDLDHFKDVNDTLGHAAGDALLQAVVQRLQQNMRETDVLARLGGDEFVIIQARVLQPLHAERLAARLVELMAQPFDLGGSQARIGASIGIALAAPHELPTPQLLLQQADLAMYCAKGEGRSAFRFFEPGMNDGMQARRALEADLRLALAEGQFELHFQPQVTLAAGTDTPVVQGAEALLRWFSPSRGAVSPDQFIDVAEESGLIVPIGEWVLRQACLAALAWSQPLRVAVNVSAVQLRHPRYVDQLCAMLAETGLPPERLELEITESAMIENEVAAMAVMDRCRAMGVRLAMDDFGTGYSSLGYLRKFRFDKIKIDQSFIRGLGESNEADAIVRAVLGMARALGVGANAEGVETAEQAAILRHEGCGEVQGYFYGRPMPPAQFISFLERGQNRDITPCQLSSALHDGSDASVGVTTWRSLKPATSMLEMRAE